MLVLSDLNKKNILIYGYGKTGESLKNFFIKKKIKANIKIYDDKKKLTNTYYLKNIIHYKPDFIFLSPGINIYNHKHSNFFKTNKEKIFTDLDVFSTQLHCTNKIIGVTGTNGKSSYCKLLYKILKKNKVKSVIVGNYGDPALNNIHHKNTIFIIELSSYQIDYSKIIKLNKAVILNISPDHLDRHRTLMKYIKTKLKIFDFVNYKNKKNCLINDFSSNKLYEKLSGKYLRCVRFKNNVSKKKFFLKKLLSDCGVINFNFSEKDYQLPHRNELCKKKNNLIYVNDSKSTNLASLKYSLLKYNNIILICGGLLKKGDKWDLRNERNTIIEILIIGKNTNFLINKFKKYKINHKNCKKMNIAIKYIKKKYLNNLHKDKTQFTILLSPGAASYDQYKNFESRGNQFKKLINAI